MNSLSIENIHKIREEHANRTRNMTFDQYKTELHQEIKPVLDLLKSMKSKKKNVTAYSIETQTYSVAEPQMEYKTKK